MQRERKGYQRDINAVDCRMTYLSSDDRTCDWRFHFIISASERRREVYEDFDLFRAAAAKQRDRHRGDYARRLTRRLTLSTNIRNETFVCDNSPRVRFLLDGNNPLLEDNRGKYGTI